MIDKSTATLAKLGSRQGADLRDVLQQLNGAAKESLKALLLQHWQGSRDRQLRAFVRGREDLAGKVKQITTPETWKELTASLDALLTAVQSFDYIEEALAPSEFWGGWRAHVYFKRGT